MSKTTRLLVLGVVRIFQPVHGYDVRRELVSWHAADWASVAPGIWRDAASHSACCCDARAYPPGE